jgi:uncharacterized membrane protein YedE/YeeE
VIHLEMLCVAAAMAAYRSAGAVGVRVHQCIVARRELNDDGQATAEYALVLLGAAAVALAVVSWASRTNVIGKLLDMVFGGLIRKAE